jgi:phosphoribosylformimino-5-aminoimidazole carboxamide ribotide isomerase
MPFPVIPVIDLLNGQAVHAIGGRRAHYQPLNSRLHTTSEPVSLAVAMHDRLGSRAIYLADIDAIEGRPPHLSIYRKMIASGIPLWIDAGVRDEVSLDPLLALDPSTTIIVGLETVSGPLALAEIVTLAGADRVIFSLDLFHGQPRIADPTAWKTADPRALASAAIACGVQKLLILDLARVGTGQGPGTGDLFRWIRQSHPAISVALGGGISRIHEIAALCAAGASAVLVGSAIHDGRITAEQIQNFDTLNHDMNIDYHL